MSLPFDNCLSHNSVGHSDSYCMCVHVQCYVSSLLCDDSLCPACIVYSTGITKPTVHTYVHYTCWARPHVF